MLVSMLGQPDNQFLICNCMKKDSISVCNIVEYLYFLAMFKTWTSKCVVPQIEQAITGMNIIVFAVQSKNVLDKLRRMKMLEASIIW